MKKIYFYDLSTKLLKLQEPFEIADDFECPLGCTDKVPQIYKRARYIIKFDESDDNWIYEKRDILLWCQVSDTTEHRERKRYYDDAIKFYNYFKHVDAESIGVHHQVNNNPDDLIIYLKDKVGTSIEITLSSFTLEDIIKWIENYESQKNLTIYESYLKMKS